MDELELRAVASSSPLADHDRPPQGEAIEDLLAVPLQTLDEPAPGHDLARAVWGDEAEEDLARDADLA